MLAIGSASIRSMRRFSIRKALKSADERGGGLRARIARKLKAAKALRPRMRRVNRDDDAAFSTARGLEQNANAGGEGKDHR